MESIKEEDIADEEGINLGTNNTDCLISTLSEDKDCCFIDDTNNSKEIRQNYKGACKITKDGHQDEEANVELNKENNYAKLSKTENIAEMKYNKETKIGNITDIEDNHREETVNEIQNKEVTVSQTLPENSNYANLIEFIDFEVSGSEVNDKMFKQNDEENLAIKKKLQEDIKAFTGENKFLEAEQNNEDSLSCSIKLQEDKKDLTEEKEVLQIELMCEENEEESLGVKKKMQGNIKDFTEEKEVLSAEIMCKRNEEESLYAVQEELQEDMEDLIEEKEFLQAELMCKQNEEESLAVQEKLQEDAKHFTEEKEVSQAEMMCKENEEESLAVKKRLQEEINDFTKEKKVLENELIKLHKTFQIERDGKISEMNQLKITLLALKEEKDHLSSDIGRFQEDMGSWLHNLQQNAEQSILSLESLYQRDSQEKRELLSEMTSMNEELNRRGETISSLKEVVSVYEKKVTELNNEQDCNISTIKQLREELSDRTQRVHELSSQHDMSSNTISQLRDELSNTSQRLQDLDNQQNVSNNTIKQLRDEFVETSQRLHNTTSTCKELEAELARLREHHVEGDQASTSTVSRVEESARLRDVEDSFEDRYCKLKVVAAKLKKRATETQQVLENERQKWASERNDMVNKLNHLTASARNNQTLQQECDRLADELEAERKECKMLRKAATDVKTSEVSLKVKLEEAQTNIEILKVNLDSAVQERDNMTHSLANKEAELEAALKEKVAEELIRKEKTKEVTALEEKLKEEEEKLAQMQKAVGNAKLEARKQSVLSLEIQSYEKSLSDMSGQLSAEKGRVSNLEAEVETLQDIRDGLQEQIRLLEERIATEETRCQQAHEDVVKVRSCLIEAETNVTDLERTVGMLTGRLESERASAETATLELATLSSAVQTNTDIMIREKQELSQQVISLSSQLATLTSTLENKEEELVTIRADFEKYKVRAQSVLRRHQNAGVSQAEAEAKQQADELRQLADTLRTKLDDSVAQIEKLQSELSVANSEREAAETRCVNLNIALADKTKQLERSVGEHRTQKLSLDTLVQCYKSQLEEKEKAAQEQMISLTEEVENLRRQLREKSEQSIVPPEPVEQTTTITTTRAEPPLQEREDGEGSEYIPEYSPTSSPLPVSPKPLLPLDKLLETNDNLHGEREQLEGEISALRGDLERSRKRAHHQAALLAETEQDAARKEQLIAVLKKEIGRLERCIERQPHAQNTEYLKNIVFKFVTLETGEDRMRLVPVITTLLQLSPEETQRLSVIAKGESGDTAVGWGSYFSTWR